MNIYQFIILLRKYSKVRFQVYEKKIGRFNLILLTIAFISSNIYSQHLFSVEYSDLSKEKVNFIMKEIASFNASVSTILMTKNNNNKDVYSFFLSSDQNAKIIILSEKTGNNVIITPAEGAPKKIEFSPFFIEELRQAVLGDADRYLVAETDENFSVINVTSFSATSREIFLPSCFYGSKENVKEALPRERQIIHVFKEKPKLIPAFPEDPENLILIEKIEEDMSYYVYMYELQDGTLIIYDENFISNSDKNGLSLNTSTITCCTNLQFNLTGSLSSQQRTATEYALGLWSGQLAGMVPVSINTSFISMPVGVLGGSYRQPNYWNSANQTWYCSALGNQLAGYNVVTAMDDIRIEMNSYYSNNFYYGLDGNAGSLIDWVTVILHEVTHGLGFYPLCGSNGAYSYTTSTGGSSSTNYPGIYDRQLYQGTTGNTCLTDLSQSQRASLVTSDNLYAGRQSSNLLNANGGNRVKIYAPSTWQSGSSVSHWDQSVSNFSTFMKYAYVSPLHTFNTRKIAIMRDMGWEIPCPPVTYFSGIVYADRVVTGCNVSMQSVAVINNA